MRSFANIYSMITNNHKGLVFTKQTKIIYYNTLITINIKTLRIQRQITKHKKHIQIITKPLLIKTKTHISTKRNFNITKLVNYCIF